MTLGLDPERPRLAEPGHPLSPAERLGMLLFLSALGYFTTARHDVFVSDEAYGFDVAGVPVGRRVQLPRCPR